MGKIYIVTNVSSKSKLKAGIPYAKLGGAKVPIIDDCIEREASGSLDLRFGYDRTENLRRQVYLNNDCQWYQYKVPFFKDGQGHLKEISEFKYKVLKKWHRFWLGRMGFITLCVIIIMLILVKSLLV